MSADSALNPITTQDVPNEQPDVPAGEKASLVNNGFITICRKKNKAKTTSALRQANRKKDLENTVGTHTRKTPVHKTTKPKEYWFQFY
jgi:hypothetical protein